MYLLPAAIAAEHEEPPAENLAPAASTAIQVVAKPHPFSSELVRAVFPAGLSLLEIAGPEAQACRIEICGIEIPREWWGRIRPKPGIAVLITRFPQGGAKNILRIIAFAALAIATGFIAAPGGFFVATMGLGQIAAGALAAVVGIGGMLLINALIPPQVPGQSAAGASFNPLKSITGTSNQANPYGAIPCVLGTIRLFPPLAAVPYSEISGNDQYLRLLFDVGYGNVTIADMKIGESDLASFTDVQYEIGTSPTLYSNAMVEAAVTTEMDTDGTVVTKTSGPNADELGVDFIFPAGLFSTDRKGTSQFCTCDMTIEYSPTGAGTWSNAKDAAGLTISNFSCAVSGSNFRTGNSARQAVRVGVCWQVSHGQYDVRVTRVTTAYGSSDPNLRQGNMQWGILRTISHTMPSTTGTTKIALRIKATDQLNGSINQFNCVASQQIPVWTGSAWVTESSSNPAFIYRWLLKDSPANARHVDGANITDADLIAWATECTAKEFTFDQVINQSTTVFALLRDLCAAGRASFTVRDGKYTVVRDILQSTPVQHFSPRNSWQFQGTRVFTDVVHALRVQFINPAAAYQQDEIVVYDDGYTVLTATKFETFTVRGCTNANGAWRLGRYHLAAARLRPNIYTFNADIENLVCTRGDMVLFSHDVIATGLAWGRIKSVTLDGSSRIIAATLDEGVPMDGVSSYSMRVRNSLGQSIVTGVDIDSGSAIFTIVFPAPIAAGSFAAGDLFLFGLSGSESLALLVTKIEPGADLTAKITAVDAASAVLNADSGTPPAFTSSITGQPWNDAPPPPQIVIVSSSQLGSGPGDNGTTGPVVTVGLGGPPSHPVKPPRGCVEVGTPVEFYPDSEVTEEEIANWDWIELDVPGQAEPLRMSPDTLVSVLRRADELRPEDRVELKHGMFFQAGKTRQVCLPSRKVIRQVKPWRTYFARGVRLHNKFIEPLGE